ncbi:hypothetical protein BDV12DRAFT_183790 [Aspergillus spectabilis]
MYETERTNPSLVTDYPKDQPPQLVLKYLSIPAPGPAQILVKVSHAAQNPTDVKSLDRNAYGPGAVLGCDFVGDVVDIGSNAKKVKRGDVIAGLIRGGEIKELGAFTTYTLAEENLSFKLPTNISREEASTIPLAVTTAWMGLFSKGSLGLDRVESESSVGCLLVWGGGSSVGSAAIQLAALHGIKVVTTCNPRHESLLRAYGAKEVFDYKDENVIEKIRAAAPDLLYVFDTIGNSTSSGAASKAITRNGGKLCTVLPGKGNTGNVASGVEILDVFVWTVFGRDTGFKGSGLNGEGGLFWPASKEECALAGELYKNLPGWLESGRFKMSTPKVFGGLESVSQGFQEQREGRISGYKIVYRV